MQKNFDNWNKRKKNLHDKDSVLFYSVERGAGASVLTCSTSERRRRKVKCRAALPRFCTSAASSGNALGLCPRVLYHAREIWWCSLGVNIGFEQDGSGLEYRRPVLILKGLSVEPCLIVPLTTSSQKHFLRPSIGVVGGKEAHALLSQLRVIDTKRLIRKVGYLEKEIFEMIRKAAKTMF